MEKTTFIRAITEMAGRGQIGACVPIAFKDAGMDVPISIFIKAALSNALSPEEAAAELGYDVVRSGDLTVSHLYERLEEYQQQGIKPFLKIGVPTQMGVLGSHLNAVVGKIRQEHVCALILGGVPPFGEEKGKTFQIAVLEKVVPLDGILLLRKAFLA